MLAPEESASSNEALECRKESKDEIQGFFAALRMTTPNIGAS
jgi:hypothetical protein